MLRISFIACIIFVLGSQSKAQSFKNSVASEAYRHHVDYEDHQVSFYTLPLDKSAGKIKLDRLYHWWSGREIKMTQGGYSGKLLHGNFNSYYPSKQLKEQGEFKKGLREGVWSEWNKDGKLTARVNYRKGLASGDFDRYNELGQLIEEGNYRDGKLHGKLKKYVTSDSIVVTKYKNGILSPEKKEVPWWKRFWKKKKK